MRTSVTCGYDRRTDVLGKLRSIFHMIFQRTVVCARGARRCIPSSRALPALAFGVALAFVAVLGAGDGGTTLSLVALVAVRLHVHGSYAHAASGSVCHSGGGAGGQCAIGGAGGGDGSGDGSGGGDGGGSSASCMRTPMRPRRSGARSLKRIGRFFCGSSKSSRTRLPRRGRRAWREEAGGERAPRAGSSHRARAPSSRFYGARVSRLGRSSISTLAPQHSIAKQSMGPYAMLPLEHRHLGGPLLRLSPRGRHVEVRQVVGRRLGVRRDACA